MVSSCFGRKAMPRRRVCLLAMLARVCIGSMSEKFSLSDSRETVKDAPPETLVKQEVMNFVEQRDLVASRTLSKSLGHWRS